MNTVKRAAVVMDKLNPAQKISHDIWFWISEQAAACESQIGALKLRSGFLSFPDNILSDVLEFASYQQNKDEHIAIKSTVNAATKLSHVCSRFRTLALSTPKLWNRIAPSMRIVAISSCVARCGTEGVQIIIPASSFHEDLSTFALRIAEEAYLWRRFELVCKDLSPDHIINLTNLRLGTLGVDAPLLSELDIRYPHTALNLKDDLRGGKSRDGLLFY